MQYRTLYKHLVGILLLAVIMIPELHAQDNRVASWSITADMGGYADWPSLSGDGRYVAFRFRAAPDGSGRTDVYVMDRVTGERQLVTAGPAGITLLLNGHNPVISENGRYVLYFTSKSALAGHVYSYRVFDRLNGTTETVVDLKAGSSTVYAGISADGRYVTYRAPVGSQTGVFVRDMVLKSTVQVGPLLPGISGTTATQMDITADGRYVTVLGRQQNGDHRYDNLLVIDTLTGSTELANVNNAGQRGTTSGAAAVQWPSMSADGMTVTFTSPAPNLVIPSEKSESVDLFIRDRRTGTTERIDRRGSATNWPELSANGRYIVFLGQALINPTQTGYSIHRYDRVTKTSRGVHLPPDPNNYPTISGNGRYVAFSHGYPGGAQLFIADFGPSQGITASRDNLALTEGGLEGTYDLALTTAPTADVTVDVVTDTQLTAARTQLLFTPANWNTPQTVSLKAVQDNVVEGMHSAVVTHNVRSTDPAYQLNAVHKVDVVIHDAVIPTIAVAAPYTVAWVQPNLPVVGTARPGATVLVVAANTVTNAVFSMSAVADASGNWSATFSDLTDGLYHLQAEADAIKSTAITVAVDSHAPVSTLIVSPTASGQWYTTSPVVVTISASDGVGGMGVARSEYSVDGRAFRTISSAGLSRDAQGTNTLCYRSVDIVNNIEPERCVTIAIDSWEPSVSIVTDTATRILTITATDSGSGVASIEYSRDGGNTWIDYAGPIGFDAPGTYVVHYRARDHAGNQILQASTVSF